MVDWNLKLSKGNLGSGSLYLKLSWMILVRWAATHKTYALRGLLCVHSAPNNYNNLVIVRREIRRLGVADFKWRHKALRRKAYVWHFPLHVHLSVTDNNLISSRTSPTYSIKVPGIRVHFHKIFFVRIRKWANYLSTKTPQRTVDPKADRNDLN